MPENAGADIDEQLNSIEKDNTRCLILRRAARSL
jgi:hypothetical protein